METLKQWLPQVSIGVVIISFLNLYFYYAAFGIQIQSYIDISEIIFSLTVFISSASFLVYFSIMFHLISKGDAAPTNVLDTKEDNKAYKYLSSHANKNIRRLRWFFDKFTMVWYALTLVLALMILLIVYGLSKDDLLKSAVVFDFFHLILIAILSGYVIFLSLWSQRRNELKTSDLNMYFIIVVAFIILFLIYRNNNSAQLVKDGHAKFDVELITSNRVYITNDTILYIGATKNFYFLYNCNNEVSTVVPSNSVVEAKFHRIRGGL